METDVLISSVVLGSGEGGDYRPHATVKRTEPAEIISGIAQTHYELCDEGYEPIDARILWRNDRTGMLFREIDEIEHNRSARIFFLPHRNN